MTIVDSFCCWVLLVTSLFFLFFSLHLKTSPKLCWCLLTPLPVILFWLLFTLIQRVKTRWYNSGLGKDYIFMDWLRLHCSSAAFIPLLTLPIDCRFYRCWSCPFTVQLESFMFGCCLWSAHWRPKTRSAKKDESVVNLYFIEMIIKVQRIQLTRQMLRNDWQLFQQ